MAGNTSRVWESGVATFLRSYQQQAINEFHSEGYRTNDIVEIEDDPAKALQEPKLSINGTRLDLKVRELLLVFVLARHTRALTRNRALPGNSSSTFLSVSSLLREIDRVKAQVGLTGLWENPIDIDVYRTISHLRSKLSRAGFSQDLIKGKRKSGYRLSVPAWNVITPATGNDSPRRPNRDQPVQRIATAMSAAGPQQIPRCH